VPKDQWDAHPIPDHKLSGKAEADCVLIDGPQQVRL